MICAHLSDAAIEMTASQLRAARVIANRRALAALLHHHGDRPPESGCSAEAIQIRQHLDLGRSLALAATAGLPVPCADADIVYRSAADLARDEPIVDAAALKASLNALVAEVAAKHRCPVDLLLAPPRRAAQRSVERRAQLANREAMYRAYHEICPHFAALGRHFGKTKSAIQKATALHAACVGADEGMG